MKELPIGIQDFAMLRQADCLYVDKTARLEELVTRGRRYFLSRPRRFGKSLMLSTIEAMFSGRVDLFKRLAADAWVIKQAESPCPVLRFDMSRLRQYSTAEELNEAIIKGLEDYAALHGFSVKSEKKCGGTLLQIIYHLYKTQGYSVILIDEYDKPVLDNIGDLKKADEMREVLRSFYVILKSCDEYLRFLMLTGISNFSKAGVFSALNNLQDISMTERYGDIAGYTHRELEQNFDSWLEASAENMSQDKTELLDKIQKYYDGFSFDGRTRLYNPFSVLSFFQNSRFGNYWYTSGSPAFIVQYMRKHAIGDPEEYRHIKVASDFADAHEIERSRPESFLFQSGYLTVEKWEDDVITLDYPNEEVKRSLLRMYLDDIYNVKMYLTLGAQLWEALAAGDMQRVVELYNVALSGIPYDDFSGRSEFWYRSLFLMLLRGAGVAAYAEVHTYRGCSDLVIEFENLTAVIEFKFAAKTADAAVRKTEGELQIKERDYAKFRRLEGRRVIAAVIVADDEKRQAELHSFELDR